MDIASTIAPKSDQLDADDLLAGPRTVTITGIGPGPSNEQPVNISLAEFDRPWRPSKTVRRLLVLAWGNDGAMYVGRRLTIYRDPTVKYGGIAVGGIRVSHMSDLERPLEESLQVSRGKRARFTVQPIHETVPITVKQVQACDSVEELRAMWTQADPGMQEVIQRRVMELNVKDGDSA